MLYHKADFMSIATKCICGAAAYCIGAPGICAHEKKPKPIKARPHFYSTCLPEMQEISMGCGYNLIAHGSMNRDLDLVAIPWTDEPEDHFTLLCKLEKFLKGVQQSSISGYNGSLLPGGRMTYHIDLNRGGRYNNYLDEQWYLDISITPLTKMQ